MVYLFRSDCVCGLWSGTTMGDSHFTHCITFKVNFCDASIYVLKPIKIDIAV